MKSLVAKRSITIGQHKTSVTLEEAFWSGLKEIASNRRLTLSGVVAAIDSERANSNLSSAIRLFVLDHYREQVGAAAGTRDVQTNGKDAQYATR
jgi:predicted DNA-binding ribbon-helix-helix protein